MCSIDFLIGFILSFYHFITFIIRRMLIPFSFMVQNYFSQLHTK